MGKVVVAVQSPDRNNNTFDVKVWIREFEKTQVAEAKFLQNYSSTKEVLGPFRHHYCTFKAR